MYYNARIRKLEDELIPQAEQDLRDGEEWAADGGPSEFRRRMAEVQKCYDELMELREELRQCRIAVKDEDALAAERERLEAIRLAEFDRLNPDLVPF